MLTDVPLDLEKIKAFRKERGLTLAQAAERADMAKFQQWQAIELGRIANPGILTVERMARALGVTVNDLLKDD